MEVPIERLMTTGPQTEPRNPFYFLLLLASLAFSVTALAYAVIPTMEQKAAALDRPALPSPFRDALRSHGGTCLMVELAAMVVFGVASMGLDRLRSLRKQRQSAKLADTRPPD